MKQQNFSRTYQSIPGTQQRSHSQNRGFAHLPLSVPVRISHKAYISHKQQRSNSQNRVIAQLPLSVTNSIKASLDINNGNRTCFKQEQKAFSCYLQPEEFFVGGFFVRSIRVCAAGNNNEPSPSPANTTQRSFKKLPKTITWRNGLQYSFKKEASQ